MKQPLKLDFLWAAPVPRRRGLFRLPLAHEPTRSARALSPHRHRRADRRRQDDAGAPARRPARRRAAARAAGARTRSSPASTTTCRATRSRPSCSSCSSASARCARMAQPSMFAPGRSSATSCSPRTRSSRKLTLSDEEYRLYAQMHAADRGAAARARPRHLAAGVGAETLLARVRRRGVAMEQRHRPRLPASGSADAYAELLRSYDGAPVFAVDTERFNPLERDGRPGRAGRARSSASKAGAACLGAAAPTSPSTDAASAAGAGARARPASR